MSRNVDDIIRKLTPRRRKKVEARAAQLIAEEGGPQALKRGHILNDLAARVKLVPFPRPFELDFFRNL